MPFSCSCASAVVYYYFQGFSAGHKRIISYSSTWQKYFILPLFQRWTQVKVIMTWFIIIWMDDGELIAFDGASCDAAYETKYKLTGNAFDEVKNLSSDSVMCSLNHPQNRWYKHVHSIDHKGKKPLGFIHLRVQMRAERKKKNTLQRTRRRLFKYPSIFLE